MWNGKLQWEEKKVKSKKRKKKELDKAMMTGMDFREIESWFKRLGIK